MSPQRTFATTKRVLRQLRHDPRTIALLMVVPSMLIIILRYVFDGALPSFYAIAPAILGIFPFTVMFVITSISMVRERTGGTLERLMASPLAKLDLLVGYGLAFSFLAILQASLAGWVTLGLLHVPVAGGVAEILLVALLSGLLGTSLGLALSALAKTEFQAVQFLPAIVLPQLLICGLFVARDQMAPFLQWISNVVPLTYIVEAMKQVTGYSTWTHTLTVDVLIIAGFTVGALILGATTLRRSR